MNQSTPNKPIEVKIINSPAENFKLNEILKSFWKDKWIFIICITLTSLLSFFYIKNSQKKWISTATLVPTSLKEIERFAQGYEYITGEDSSNLTDILFLEVIFLLQTSTSQSIKITIPRGTKNIAEVTFTNSSAQEAYLGLKQFLQNLNTEIFKERIQFLKSLKEIRLKKHHLTISSLGAKGQTSSEYLAATSALSLLRATDLDTPELPMFKIKHGPNIPTKPEQKTKVVIVLNLISGLIFGSFFSILRGFFYPREFVSSHYLS